MENIIVILILIAIATGIIFYLIRAKRKGEKCVGCPYAKKCNGCSSKSGNKNFHN
ncbi:MAG: FeoB-associated Cys-rich membrane protein [Ruminococcaceae bacterium]|nr:FeoB-associated Cys-rich membrane protein [Oscillospiraceae bacterium]